MPPFSHLLIGQILVDRHGVSTGGIKTGLDQQDQEERERGERRFLGEILVERQLTSHEDVAKALAFQREQFAQSLVGPYRLESLQGRGSAGSVFRAVRLGGKSNGPPIVLKLLPQKRPGDVDGLARFQREAQAGVSLDHPHIVRTLDFGTTRDCYYLVCELMPNGTLRDRVRIHGLMNEADVLILAVALLQALDHANTRGLVHRDIKPANILYDNRDNPRLADMGLAQAIVGDGQQADRAAGTPAFIAPEQAIGQDKSDGRADQYSLGATLFYALTGAPPFVEKSSLEVINQHLNQAPPNVTTINRAVSAATGALLRKLMAKRPEDRYANAAEAIADVRRIQAGERPLAMDLSPERAFAPLKIQVQTRDAVSTERTPTKGHAQTRDAAGTERTPTKGHAQTRDAADTEHTPASVKTKQGSQSTQTTIPTQRTIRSQQRPNGTGPQDLAKNAQEPATKPKPNPARQEPITDRTKKRAPAAKEPLRDTPRSGGAEAKPVSDPFSHVAAKARMFWGLIIASGVLVVGLGALTATILLMGKSPAPPPPPVAAELVPTGTVIDLMSKIDAQLVKKGDWMLREGVLTSPRGAKHLLPIGYLPPVEYDLTCSFKRIYPSGSLSLLFDVSGRQCALVVSGDTETYIGFELVGGRPLGENPSRHTIPVPLDPNKRLTLTLQVRRSGLSVLMGEDRICTLASGPQLALDESWKLPDAHVLGIGTKTTQVAIFQLRLTEISGAGAHIQPVSK